MSIQWPLVIFSLLAGCGGVTFAFVGVSELLGTAKKARSVATIVALAMLVIGGCASVLHLAQPANIMAAAANVFSFSGISVELIMLGINVILCVAYLLVSLKGASESAAKGIAIVGILTGLAMAFVVGNGYVMESQPNWNTPLLPIAYLGSGIGCGAAVFLSIHAALGSDEGREGSALGIVAIAGLVLQLVAFLGYGAAIGFAVDAAVYWGGAVLVGSVGAIACAVAARKTPAAWYGAAACALVGGLALRACMWMLGYGFIQGFALAASRSVLGI